MTCNEFIKYVLDTKKVQYDVNLLNNVIKPAFLHSILYLENRVDFDYLFQILTRTLQKDTFSIQIPRLKHTVHIIDKKRRCKLYETVFDVELAYILPAGIPSSARVIDDTIYFNVRAIEDIEYVISAYIFTDTTNLDFDKPHPLVVKYPDLLFYTLAMHIDKYYEDTQSLNVDLNMVEKLLKEAKRVNFYNTGRMNEPIIKVR